MADANLGTATLRTKLDTQGLKTGFNQAKAETEKFAGDSVTAIKGIGAAFGAVVASQGLRAYIGFMRSAATEAHQATAASALFAKALERNGQSAADGAAMVQRLADKFGVVNSVVEESATFMLRQGASVDDVERALTAAGASAAAAGFDISTAFNNVGVAVATGRSQLLETSGIVANLGPVAQVYAKSVGKTVEQLTQQELIQARVNAIYEETKSEIEDVDILLKGLPRSQAEVTRQFRAFRETAGDLALKVLVPLNEGLATGLRLVNGLPEPVKQAGIAMVGAAVGATALAAGVVAIKAALTGLSGLGLLSFGPAGWVVLGITAVAGLAAALAATGGDSLTSAVNDARKAIASGSKDSMTGALDELIKQVNGPVKESLQGMRDELVATGNVGVEQAQRMLTEMAKAQLDARRSILGLSLFGPSPLGDALATGGALLGKLDLKEQVRAALDNNELLTAIDLLQDAIVAMTEAGLDPRRSQPLVNLLSEIGSIPNFQFAPPPPPAPTPSPTGAGGGGGTSEAARTWQDVLNDLDKSGTEAMRRAAFEGTDEAFRAAATKRVSLIDDAITEALTTYYGQVSTGELEALRARRAAAEREASARPLTSPDVVATMNLDNSAAERALLASVDARQRSTVVAVRASVGRTFDGIADGVTAFGETLNAARDAYYTARFGDTTAEMQRFATTTAGLTATIKAANDEAARMEVFAAAAAKYGAGRAGLAGTSAAERGGVFTGVDRDAAAAVARETVETVVQAFKDGSGSIDDVRTAVDTLTTLTPMSVTAINELTDGILQLERAALDAARAAEQNERAPMWVPPGGLPPVPTAGLPTSTYQGFRPRESIQADLDAAARINKQREESADRFSQTVVSAGFDFGNAAIKAFQDGDVVGVLRAGLGGAGSIIGGMDLGGLSFLGGTIGIGSLIAGGLGLLGTLIGALAGGGNKTELESRRAAGVTPRGAPAIDLSIIINQSLNIQSLTDTASRRAVDGLLDDMVRRVEDTLKRNVLPRLDKLEGATA